ncbi:HNH endonuclease [Acinetobacter brisouii]
MANWLASVNPKTYDITKAFHELPEVYWGLGKYKHQVNDIIYLYVTGPVAKVMYKFQVVRHALNDEYPKNQEIYWKNREKLEGYQGEYAVLRAISQVDKEILSRAFFIQEGHINKTQNFQGRITDRNKVKNDPIKILLEHIAKQFPPFEEETDYADEANVKSDLFPEGAKQTVQVNRYERNPAARAKCIEIYGARCTICKMSFEETYGTFAKDFIHVHHKTPLHQISENYEVNPETDLIPVCPNCHAMLHRHENGKPIEVEQLKQLYEDQKKLSRSQT